MTSFKLDDEDGMAGVETAAEAAVTDSERRRVRSLEANNDALRADIDALLEELDAAQEALRRAQESHARTAAERTRIEQAHTSAIREIASVAAERDAALAEVEARAAEEARLVGAAEGLASRVASLADEARRVRAIRDAEDYRRSVDDRLAGLREESLRAHTSTVHAAARRIERSRMSEARRAAQLESELEATRSTFSWRVTAPVRALRRAWSTVLSRLGAGRPASSESQAVVDPATMPIPRPLAVPAEAPDVDLDYYRSRYPDLAEKTDQELYSHYLRSGRREGRTALSLVRRSIVRAEDPADPRPRVLVVAITEVSPTLAEEAVALVDGLSRDYHVVTVRRTKSGDDRDGTVPAGTVIDLPADLELGESDYRAFAVEVLAMPEPLYAVVIQEGTAEAAPGPWAPFFALLAREEFPIISLEQATAGTAGESAAKTVDAMALDILRVRARKAAELETLLAAGRQDQQPDDVDYVQADQDRAARYLALVELAAPLHKPYEPGGHRIPRPRPGFHPLVYAESAPGFIDDGSDPLAHFLSNGRPEGRWSRRIITPPVESGHRGTDVRVLVHGHFYYPELVPEFLSQLSANSHPRTLVLTTHSAEAAAQIEELASEYNDSGSASVIVVANRGRNLSALLCDPVASLVSSHDLVLHVHGKRSPHAVDDYGRQWRKHLWTHLVGDGSGFADHIIEEFASDPRLGLVAPEDPRLHDWDRNRAFVPAWLDRLGSAFADGFEVPVHFDFPLGAMFWARSSALAPFLEASLGDSDFPQEPLPVDGSSLHALERLVPLVIEHQGFEFAKTYVAPSQELSTE